INRLIKPTPSDSTPSSWVIEIKEAELKNARFSLIDSVSLAEQAQKDSLPVPSHTFNYAHLQLGLLNLNAGATIRSRNISVTIRSLSFESNRPNFALSRLSGEFSLTPVQAEIKKLSIETPKSLITVSAKLGRTDITKIKDLSQLEHSPVSLSLKVDKLDFKELQQFIGSSVDFLAKEAGCQLDAEGTFGNLNVRNFTLHTAHSVIRSTGTISNLHHPKDLELDLTCLNNKIDPQDALEYLPGLKIPDLTTAGTIKYDMWFKGKPTLFKGQLAVNSKAGKIDFDGTIDAREGQFLYDAVIRTTHFDVGSVLKDNSLSSKLNATITLKGAGAALQTLASTAQVSIDSSEFYGLPVGPTVISLDAAERVLRARVSASISSSRLEFNGTMKMPQQEATSFQLDGKVYSLNLADLTKEKKYTSDLSFDLHADGAGLNLNGMRGSLDVNFSRSSFGKESFQKGKLNIAMNTADASKQSFHLTSDVASLEVQGKFNPRSFVAAITQGSKIVGEAVQYRFVALDSLRSHSSKFSLPEFQSNSVELKEIVNAEFILHVSNGYPIGVFLGTKLDGNFDVKGSITGNREEIRFDSDVNIKRFGFSDESVQVGVRDAGLKFEIGGLSHTSVLASLNASVQLHARSMNIDSLLLSNVLAEVQSKGAAGKYQVSAAVDSGITVGLKGVSRSDSGLVFFETEQLKIAVNSYGFENA
ncbi:MAG: hypothetical protein HY089_10905, partial [Ignavibacteriales bacterium]|nr:hypothetical protein [Ignavibacteriales bacterium]